MLSGKQLAAELAKTGTGKDKLDICLSVTRADTAIERLVKAEYRATARKAVKIVEEHEAEQAKDKAEKDAAAKAEAEAKRKADDEAKAKAEKDAKQQDTAQGSGQQSASPAAGQQPKK